MFEIKMMSAAATRQPLGFRSICPPASKQTNPLLLPDSANLSACSSFKSLPIMMVWDEWWIGRRNKIYLLQKISKILCMYIIKCDFQFFSVFKGSLLEKVQTHSLINWQINARHLTYILLYFRLPHNLTAIHYFLSLLWLNRMWFFY